MSLGCHRSLFGVNKGGRSGAETTGEDDAELLKQETGGCKCASRERGDTKTPSRKPDLWNFLLTARSACPFDSPAGLQPRNRWEQIERLRGKGRGSTGDHRACINVEVSEETQNRLIWRK